MLITRDPIVVEPLLAETAGPARGGTCLFLGTVRDAPDDHGVTEIEYSGYEAMIEAEFAGMLAEARERWPDARASARHRLGPVPLGEASVAIVVAAPHRDEAFVACRYLIEAVKARLPIWKKEQRRDGSSVWVTPADRT
ncbi:MAG TPA: molybdenum cofactor biosynthesis protein MoaE [Gemmatimonadales bacterium]|nr:molybdenum cofactor biosynthesis protein MoaE [Gemmatimonadales bacterium]